MGEAFRLGGWGMFPTAIAGLLLVAAAAGFAARPDRRRFTLAIWMYVVTLLAGVLGFVAGAIKTTVSAQTLAPENPGMTVIVGLGEAAHCLGMAIGPCLLGSIIVAVGLSRARGPVTKSEGGSLVDPLG
jgi:hypothetical protein